MNFKCGDCKESKVILTTGGTGYARIGRKKICYDCCAVRDRADMRATGRAVFYLVAREGRLVVTNWPGTLEFPVYHTRKGQHNMAGTMVSVWFTDSEGKKWYGRNIGDNQILRCKRLK